MIALSIRTPLRTAILLAVLILSLYWSVTSFGADVVLPHVTADPKDLSPAGHLIIDAATNEPAVAPMTMNFVRTPDNGGPDGRGRFLIAVNSGYGLLFSARGKAQQTLSVIDVSMSEPKVVQNVYFSSPQSANVGLAFNTTVQPDGKYRLYVSGGFQNKVWILSYDPKEAQPLSPPTEPDKQLDAPAIDVSAFAANAPSPQYNSGAAPVYPTGVALSPDGEKLFTANNLSDNLGIISNLRGGRGISRISLQRPGGSQLLYPYDVKLLSRNKLLSKAYVSLWGDAAIAVVDLRTGDRLKHIAVDRHPTMMMLDRSEGRLFVVNSDADSVSVIDTATDRVIERINVKLNESEKNGVGPEGIALSGDEKTLYVSNAQANAVAVIRLEKRPSKTSRSRIVGFIPTGNYPSAVAVVGSRLFIANGKGTGMENSSLRVNSSGLYPNMPNQIFPGARYNKGGMYSVGIVAGNFSLVDVPGERDLYSYTQAVMRNNGLLGRAGKNIFPGGRSPFKHVIYVIRENRTYDQVFGDVSASGDGHKADGEPSVAIFGNGEAARSPKGTSQKITPNAHALAARFGLLDRFFVNSEASPDGHNWSTAAFSNDYIDKAFRWNYSGRGRTYDYEGFNRLPSFDPPANQPPVALPPVFDLPATEADVARFVKRYIPYLNGGRDVGEPETLYLWDAAKRAGLTFRSYGEYIATISADDVREVNSWKPKRYPDVSPTLTAFATKRTLEGNFAPGARNFDQSTPDAMTPDSYRAAIDSNRTIDAAITAEHNDSRFRGTSRFGAWMLEFRGYVANRENGKGDALPNLSIVRLSNDHTAGISRGMPTPQFFVADNDYALGRLVQEVSASPYWKDTVIFVVEDDAQDGPDHVDAHRSPALVISAYNREGALIHEFHNTVSLIRTMELCLGIGPMNFLDAHATPIDLFTPNADLRPYRAELPEVSLDNLFPPERPSAAMLRYMQLTDEQDLDRADMADPRALNEIIWYSVKGEAAMPATARLPAFDLMTAGLKPDDENDERSDD